jgi:tetratricopeptide (TPR) repeat protein
MKSVRLPELVDIGVPNQFEINDIPFFPQKAYQCGPAALSMALVWTGIQVEPETVAPEVFTPSLKGSLQSALLGAARRHGRIAYPITTIDALVKELASGHPVIILQNLGLSWFPIWHYSLAIGYDILDGFVILHSGRTYRKHLSLVTFERTWARSDHWGLLVLPPSQLPVTAKESEYISAVIGLEKTHHWSEALKGYQTALSRWSNSLGAYIGIGNCYYQLGELKAAEDILGDANNLFPNEGVVLNNLAQVLLEQNKYNEALESVHKAIQLGGPLSPLYQKTLEEILSLKDTQQLY